MASAGLRRASVPPAAPRVSPSPAVEIGSLRGMGSGASASLCASEQNLPSAVEAQGFLLSGKVWGQVLFGNGGPQWRVPGRGLSSSCLAGLYQAPELAGSSADQQILGQTACRAAGILNFPLGNSLPVIVPGLMAACGAQPSSSREPATFASPSPACWCHPSSSSGRCSAPVEGRMGC